MPEGEGGRERETRRRLGSRRARGWPCHGGCRVLRVRAGRIDGRRGGPRGFRGADVRGADRHDAPRSASAPPRLRPRSAPPAPGQHREVLLHRRHGARAPRAPPRGRDASEGPRAERAPRTRRRSARGARAFAVAGAPRGNTDAPPTPEPRALGAGRAARRRDRLGCSRAGEITCRAARRACSNNRARGGQTRGEKRC